MSLPVLLYWMLAGSVIQMAALLYLLASGALPVARPELNHFGATCSLVYHTFMAYVVWGLIP